MPAPSHTPTSEKSHVTNVRRSSAISPSPRRRRRRKHDGIASLRGWLRVGGMLALLVTFQLAPFVGTARAEGEWEITAGSEAALERGLQWLAANQGPKGNWDSNDLGLVGMGALAFLSAGHAPGRGKYGDTVQRALDYVLDNAKPSGLLNQATAQRDMYNHGLSTFVLGQMYGMTSATDQRLNKTLERALSLIVATQAEDGGWGYQARRAATGHDLSLAVMQAKALRSAMDSGLDVPPEVIDQAIRSVRAHYAPKDGQRHAPESQQRRQPGFFTYGRSGKGESVAMMAAGVVCLQEFGQYDDWRISKNMEVIQRYTEKLRDNPTKRDGRMPYDSYTLYYVGQAMYQVGGDDWKKAYPKLRDYLVASQLIEPTVKEKHGAWHDVGDNQSGRVSGKPGDLYATSVACFFLAMPNRYLPILQEGKIESLKGQFGGQR